MTDRSMPTPTDPDIELADQTVHQSTSGAANPETTGAADGPSSLQPFTRITSSLDDINEQLATFIVSSIEDTWKEERFRSLVNSYLKSSSETLNLCISMESSTQKAKIRMLMIWYAVKLFEREVEIESQQHIEVNKFVRLLEDLKGYKAAGGDPLNEDFLRIVRLVYEHQGGNEHMCVLEELKTLKATAESPFDEQFFEMFHSVYPQQTQLFAKLKDQKEELWKNLKRIRTWRRISNIVFAVGFFAVPVLTGVVLVVTVPSAIEVLIGAFSATIGSIGKWCSYSWNKRVRAAEEQMSTIHRIMMATYVMLKDMDKLRFYTAKLELVIESLMELARFALASEEEQEERVKLVMVEMKRRLDSSLHAVEDISKSTLLCTSSITKSKNLVSEKLQSRVSRSESKTRNWLEIFM